MSLSADLWRLDRSLVAAPCPGCGHLDAPGALLAQLRRWLPANGYPRSLVRLLRLSAGG